MPGNGRFGRICNSLLALFTNRIEHNLVNGHGLESADAANVMLLLSATQGLACPERERLMKLVETHVLAEETFVPTEAPE